MAERNRSVNKNLRPAKEGESSSSSKTPTTDNPVDKMINFDTTPEDASVFFSRLPEEIWLLITDKYLDLESLTNLSNALPVFRNLLRSRRVKFLFLQVWKILGVKFEKKEDEVYSYDIDEIFPGRDLSRFRNGKTPWCSRILALRLVCKSWCEGVDKFYEDLNMDEEHVFEGEKDDNFSLRKRMGDWTNTANDSSAWRKLINYFGPTHFDGNKNRNPIIGRFICIEHQANERESAVIDLLSKNGHHFWFGDLSFESRNEFDTVLDCYTALKEIIQLLPNLKTLYVCFPRTRGAVSDSMEQEIASHPLPKLHQLEILKVEPEIPRCIFNALVSANNHVSMLDARSEYDTERGFDIYSFPMPNLKQLWTDLFLESDFENINKPEVNWPLEKLNMSFCCRRVTKLQIFSLLENKWATTLTNVAIKLPWSNVGMDSLDTDDLSVRLSLPNVQRFKINFSDIFSLDFILPMQSLEHLEVKIPPNENIEERLRLIEKHQIVQFVGFFGRFHESNIWNLIPNLKSIKVFEFDAEKFSWSTHACTREDFKRKGKTDDADGPKTCNDKGN